MVVIDLAAPCVGTNGGLDGIVVVICLNFGFCSCIELWFLIHVSELFEATGFVLGLCELLVALMQSGVLGVVAMSNFMPWPGC